MSWSRVLVATLFIRMKKDRWIETAQMPFKGNRFQNGIRAKTRDDNSCEKTEEIAQNPNTKYFIWKMRLSVAVWMCSIVVTWQVFDSTENIITKACNGHETITKVQPAQQKRTLAPFIIIRYQQVICFLLFYLIFIVFIIPCRCWWFVTVDNDPYEENS